MCRWASSRCRKPGGGVLVDTEQLVTLVTLDDRRVVASYVQVDRQQMPVKTGAAGGSTASCADRQLFRLFVALLAA